MSEPVEYDVETIQNRWLPVWDELAPFRSGRPRRLAAQEVRPRHVPVPVSGDLHMGHAEAYALGDVIARYWVQRGFNVMHPIGWDAFGLPAENAAIKRGANPVTWTYDNIASRRASMRRYACSFDWDRVLHTCDPEYYHWNQWLFLKLFERGLAYRKDSQRQLVPERPDGAGQRAGGATGRCERCDAVGHEEEADPVVPADHRLRRAAAGRHGCSWRARGRTRC
ncbi:MAG: class I tRNA ligase family protein [Candidatus Nanopelagicales bacterium]